MSTSEAHKSRPTEAWFATTHWSVVLSARDKESPQSAQALETLCRTYWYPLYAFARRQGRSPHDAQDLTQEFFARLLQKDYLRSVGRQKGKFRTFLLVVFKRFLANEWDRAHTRKRGGGQVILSLDTAAAENRYQTEPAEVLSADRIYERRWALTLLDQTLARLRAEFVQAGKAREFEHLKVFLTAPKGTIACADVAAALGLSEGAARVAIHRLRRRFRQVFRDEIALTVAGPEDMEAEIKHLLAVLSE